MTDDLSSREEVVSTDTKTGIHDSIILGDPSDPVMSAADLSE
jgi:hypothetical protein